MNRIDLQRLLSTEKFVPFYSERKNQPALTLPPIAVELHWTSECNNNCIHCSYGNRRQANGRLSPACIHSVIEDLIVMKAKAVYLSGGGEPTVMKGWDKYAQELVESGLEVALITNGVSLQSSHVDLLSKFNYVALSIYSTDEKEYEIITGNHCFDRQWVTPGLIKSGEGNVIVGARCVINKINYKNLHNIYLKAIDSGYDYIIFIPAVDYEDSSNGLGVDEQCYVNALILENKEIYNNKFTNVLNLLNRNISHYALKDYRVDCGPCLSGCSAITIRSNVFINYCGGVWLCQPHIGNPTYQIGDLHKNRLSEIWNSPRHVDVVRLLNDTFLKGECRNCRSIGFNIAGDKFDRGLVDLSNIARDPFV